MNVEVEFQRGMDLRQHDIEWFVNQGVSAIFLEQTYRREFSSILLNRVAFLPSGHFEFVHNLRGPTETAVACTLLLRDVNGDTVDVLAWQPSTGRAATWRRAVALLGEEQIDQPRLEHLAIHDGVLSWLREGRRGLVVVDPHRAARMLDGRGPLVVRSVDFGKRIRKQLTISAPEILVSQAEEAEA